MVYLGPSDSRRRVTGINFRPAKLSHLGLLLGFYHIRWQFARSKLCPLKMLGPDFEPMQLDTGQAQMRSDPGWVCITRIHSQLELKRGHAISRDEIYNEKPGQV